MEPKEELKKVSPRRANRMVVVQFLYQWEMNKPEQLLDALRVFIETQENDRDYYQFGESLIHGVIENIDFIDQEIRRYAQNWAFDRIAKVDLSVLRLAIYELSFRKDIPPIVSINEAIDLGKTFSNEESKRFINGILDQVKGKIQRPLRKASD
jgi:N utilization substance protein B